MERSGVLLGTMSETGFARAKRLQPNVGRSLKKRKRTASDAILCLCFGYAVSSAHKGTGENRPGATGRSQRPAAVERAGPFLPEEHWHVLPESLGPIGPGNLTLRTIQILPPGPFRVTGNKKKLCLGAVRGQRFFWHGCSGDQGFQGKFQTEAAIHFEIRRERRGYGHSLP